MHIIEDIGRRAAELLDEMIRLRRDFHRNPELGFREHRTAGVIAGYLKGLGMDVQEGVGKTGVVGVLEGGSPGPTLMLRADMDALPLQEKGTAPYRSVVPGVMHACGHDGHMAILLGTAAVMSGLKGRMQGRIKFVFQPAEEGSGGARRMIADGVLHAPDVDAAFGLHLITALPCGIVGLREGILMAAMDSFVLRVKGKSGHSSMPDSGADAILASARIISELQTLNAPDGQGPPSILVNVGTVRGGDASNIIAEEVVLTGTVRSLNAAARSAAPESMKRIIGHVSEQYGTGFDLDYQEGYPLLVNDVDMTELLRRTAGDTPGVDSLLELPPVMASEDMASYLQKVPGCFFFLGAGNPGKGLTRPLHSSEFDFDESAMATGAALFAGLAAAYPGMTG